MVPKRNDYLLLVLFDGSILCTDVQSGDIVWCTRCGEPLVTRSEKYVGDEGKKETATESDDGFGSAMTAVKTELASRQAVAPTFVAGLGSSKGRVFLLQDGQLLAADHLVSEGPGAIVAGEAVILNSVDTSYMEFRLSDGEILCDSIATPHSPTPPAAMPSIGAGPLNTFEQTPHDEHGDTNVAATHSESAVDSPILVHLRTSRTLKGRKRGAFSWSFTTADISLTLLKATPVSRGSPKFLQITAGAFHASAPKPQPVIPKFKVNVNGTVEVSTSDGLHLWENVFGSEVLKAYHYREGSGDSDGEVLVELPVLVTSGGRAAKNALYYDPDLFLYSVGVIPPVIAVENLQYHEPLVFDDCLSVGPGEWAAIDSSNREKSKGSPASRIQTVHGSGETSDRWGLGESESEAPETPREPPSESSLALQPSFFANNFVVQRLLGQGAEGTVFLCHHKVTLLPYAVKIVPIRAETEEIVLREVRLHALLTHENVVRFHSTWMETAQMMKASTTKLLEIAQADANNLNDSVGSCESSVGSSCSDLTQTTALGEVTKSLFIQMEYCHGTLGQWMSQRQRVSRRDNLFIACQLATGLMYLHSKGVIHRDLKPANVFLDAKELRVKLGDFGLAKISSTNDLGDSAMGRRLDVSDLNSALAPFETVTPTEIHTVGVGTPLYSSPEQLAGKNCAPESDGYSFGILLCEMYLIPTTVSERICYLERARRCRDVDPEMLSAYPELSVGLELLNPDAAKRPSLPAAKKALKKHLVSIEETDY